MPLFSETAFDANASHLAVLHKNEVRFGPVGGPFKRLSAVDADSIALSPDGASVAWTFNDTTVVRETRGSASYTHPVSACGMVFGDDDLGILVCGTDTLKRIFLADGKIVDEPGFKNPTGDHGYLVDRHGPVWEIDTDLQTFAVQGGVALWVSGLQHEDAGWRDGPNHLWVDDRPGMLHLTLSGVSTHRAYPWIDQAVIARDGVEVAVLVKRKLDLIANGKTTEVTLPEGASRLRSLGRGMWSLNTPAGMYLVGPLPTQAAIPLQGITPPATADRTIVSNYNNRCTSGTVQATNITWDPIVRATQGADWRRSFDEDVKGLACDGTHIAVLTNDALHWLDPRTGATIATTTEAPMRIASGKDFIFGLHGGVLSVLTPTSARVIGSGEGRLFSSVDGDEAGCPMQDYDTGIRSTKVFGVDGSEEEIPFIVTALDSSGRIAIVRFDANGLGVWDRQAKRVTHYLSADTPWFFSPDRLTGP